MCFIFGARYPKIKLMDFNERNLVLNVKNGDENSYNFLYEKYYKNLLCFSLKYLKSKEDSEEIVQNTFFKIWDLREDLNENLNFRAYLFQIAVNDIYNKLKKNIHEKKYHEYLKDASGDPEYYAVSDNRFDFQDILALVKKVIDKFPPQRKLIFNLKKIEGFSNEEIAKMLNISIRTIENQVFRGVKHLRTELVYCLN